MPSVLLLTAAPVAHRHACAQCGETERRLRECRGCRGCAIAAKSARCSTGSRVDTGSSAPSWQRAALRSDGSGGQTNNGCFCSLQCQPNCGFDQPVLFCLCATCSSTVSCTLQHAGASRGAARWVGGVLQGAQRRGRVKHQSESRGKAGLAGRGVQAGPSLGVQPAVVALLLPGAGLDRGSPPTARGRPPVCAGAWPGRTHGCVQQHQSA